MKGCFAVRLSKKEELLASSSGGAFIGLARAVLNQRGVVFGCVWERPSMRAVHVKASTVDELLPMRGSKYVRSDIREALKECAAELESGGTVLFVGTPCQVAAVRKATRDIETGALYLVELICHGGPDPNVWQEYLKQLGKPVIDVQFKNKKTGWNDPTMRIAFKGGEVRDEKLYHNIYARAFESGLAVTNGCFGCPFKDGKSGADITIGDYWGGGGYIPEWNDEHGISCVIVRTSPGNRLWQTAHGNFEIRSISYETLHQYNPNIVSPPKKPDGWEEFARLYKTRPMQRLVLRLLDGPLVYRFWRRVTNKIKRILRSI